MCPGNNEIAGKKSKTITHKNEQLKAIITETAWAVIRTKNTFYSARHHRLAVHRG